MNWQFKLLRLLKWMSVLVLCALALTYLFSSQFRTLVYGVGKGQLTGIQYTGGLGERVVLSNDPRVVADYFQGGDETPLIVLVHGSTPKGRGDGLIRIIACGLQCRGWSVLSIDLPGFGESADPTLPLSDGFHFEQAIMISVHEAIKRNWAKPGRIVYVGHSLGAGAVLRAGRMDPKPFGIVAIGAPCTTSLFSKGGDQLRRRFARDRFRDMAIEPDLKSVDIMAQYLEEMDPANQLSLGPLPPVLLIYGEDDGGPDSSLTMRLAESNDSVHDMKIIAGATHSYHVHSAISTIQIYNRQMLKLLLQYIESWSTDASVDGPN